MNRLSSLRPLLPILLFGWFFSIPSSLLAQQNWSVETPTGPVRNLSFEASEGTTMSVDVSPDGGHIAFDLLGTIYEMPFGGGKATALTSGRSWNLFPRYNPDGTQIAFSSDRSGSFDVWIVGRKTGQVRNLSKASKQNVYRPSWSVDGRRIFAGVSGSGVPPQLVSFGLDGGRQSLVTGGGPVNGAQSFPGGAVHLL